MQKFFKNTIEFEKSFPYLCLDCSHEQKTNYETKADSLSSILIFYTQWVQHTPRGLTATVLKSDRRQGPKGRGTGTKGVGFVLVPRVVCTGVKGIVCSGAKGNFLDCHK